MAATNNIQPFHDHGVSGTTVASKATNSWTPGTGRLAYCVVVQKYTSAGVPGAVTVAGNTLTWASAWTKNVNVGGTVGWQVTLFLATTVGGTAGATTASLAETDDYVMVAVGSLSLVSTTGTVVQGADYASAASSTSIVLTLGSALAASANNVLSVGVCLTNTGLAQSNGAGFFGLSVGQQGTVGWNMGFGPSLTHTYTTNNAARLGIIVELKQDGTGVSAGGIPMSRIQAER